MPRNADATDTVAESITTSEAARRLGLAVRSVQLMVDRGELQAWKTSGGHRRIAAASVAHWLALRETGATATVQATPAPPAAAPAGAPVHRRGDARPRAGSAAKVLLIEDSVHYQNLVRLVVQRAQPGVELLVAADAVAGLALLGREQPRLLLLDLMLPGMDGAALLASLRTHAEFAALQVVVVTSLQDAELAPYDYALHGVPVVHKSRLAAELPAQLQRALAGPG